MYVNVFEMKENVFLAFQTLLKFPVVLERLLEDLLLHSLCDYLYEVSQVFSEFYDNCYCVQKDKETSAF